MLEKKTVDDAKKAAQSLLKNLKPSQPGTSAHTGEWRKSSDWIFKTKDTVNGEEYYKRVNRKPFWQNAATKKIVKKVDNYFSRTASDLCEAYKRINAERIYGGSYLMCVINTGVVGPHYDEKDEIEGLCCVVPMGVFDGGDLVFRQQKLRFQVRTGDIIFFRSRELMHENLPCTGERYSLVFTTDHDSFTEFGQPARQYMHWKQPKLNSHATIEAQGFKPEDVPELRKTKVVVIDKVYTKLTRANTPRTKFGTLKLPSQDGNPRAPISLRKNAKKKKKATKRKRKEIDDDESHSEEILLETKRRRIQK